MKIIFEIKSDTFIDTNIFINVTIIMREIKDFLFYY